MDKSPLPCARSRHSPGSRDAGDSPSPCKERNGKERHFGGQVKEQKGALKVPEVLQGTAAPSKVTGYLRCVKAVLAVRGD